MHITLTPAYGRDYKAKGEVLADWRANKDFINATYGDPYEGKPINREQVPPGAVVNIRFKGLRNVVVVRT